MPIQLKCPFGLNGLSKLFLICKNGKAKIMQKGAVMYIYIFEQLEGLISS